LTVEFSVVGELSPADTTSLIQPVDLKVITDFERLYTKKVFHKYEATAFDDCIILNEF
jgi:hypothetical protein